MDQDAGLLDVVAAIRSHKSFVVLEHEKPDGDAIGSGLAVVQTLLALGKTAILVSSDPHPAVYDFLPGRKLHTRAAYLDPLDFSPDAAIFVDCTDPERAGQAAEFAKGKFIVNIDHHVSNSGFGDARFIRHDASATGELVFELIEALGVELTFDIAICLYVAIATDTGGFRFQNTSGHSLRVAAALLDKGVSAWGVAEQVFETRTVSSVLLLGSAMSSLKLYHGGKIAAVSVTKEMLTTAGASPEETEGIIGYPRSIVGVEVALLFKEDSEGRGFHVSFRSKNRVDVAEVAVSLGGGGHPRASGTLLKGSLQEVTDQVLAALEKAPWTDS